MKANPRDTNLTALQIRESLKRDEELTELFKQYKHSYESDEQKEAANSWKTKLNEVLE